MMGWLITLLILTALASLPLGASIIYDEDGAVVRVIVGPVKKGFNSHISYSRGSANTVKIEVSKNNGPFVLKASGDKSASYIINF